MTAIILAAGNSKRLKPITNNIPKCLLDISGKCILARQLEHLKRNNIDRVSIVVGFEKEQIKKYVLNHFPSLNVKFIENFNWEHNNNAKSLFMALSRNINEDTLVLNADTIWFGEIIENILSEKGNVLAYNRKTFYPAEDMKIRLSADNRVLNISKTTITDVDANGEFIGIAKFTGETIQDLKAELARCNLNDWFEHALQNLITKETHFFKGKDVSHFPCMEIDFPEDLDLAREYFPYDQPVWEQGQRHGSEFNQDKATGLLKDITNLLEENGIESYLNWGCLLGIYRDNQFIPWDTDIDVTCFWEDRDKVLGLISEMQKLRCFIPDVDKCYPEDFWIIRDGEKIELNFVESVGDKYIYSPGRSRLATPKSYIKPFKKHIFRGKEYNIPNETEKYLSESYGNNWHVPIKGKKPRSL